MSNAQYVFRESVTTTHPQQSGAIPIGWQMAKALVIKPAKKMEPMVAANVIVAMIVNDPDQKT